MPTRPRRSRTLLALLLAAAAGGGAIWALTSPHDPAPVGMQGAGKGAGQGAGQGAQHPALPDGTAQGRFTLCRIGGGADCVVDGDTFWMGGVKIRIADIDTPELHPARCVEEARLGEAATLRLYALLNSGTVTLQTADRDTDRYGRKLRRVTVNGRGVGDTLIAEGLARPWQGRRMGWC